MNDYSQQGECKVIHDYLINNNIKGICLDIGANDGKLFSNSLGVIQAGWQAVLVQPSPVQCDKIIELHKGNEKVKIYNIAITQEDSESSMFSCPDNQDLVSTLIQSQTKRWVEGGYKFQKMDIKTKSWKSFLQSCKYKKFDFISIDAQGYDQIILNQMNLIQLDCKVLIIQHNGIQSVKNKFILYCSKYNMKNVFDNGTNLIFIKND